MRSIDVTNHRFGELVAVSRAPNGPRGFLRFHCQCDCGNTIIVRGSSLRGGNTTSCGCRRVRELVARSTSHGMSKTPEYRLWFWAKHRAKVAGIPFSLLPSDIHIPVKCPVFGMPLVARSDGRFGALPSSPSLDRIDPRLGYVATNVWVISHRANAVKNGYTQAELTAVVRAVNTLKAGLGINLEGGREAASGIAL